MLLIIQFIVTFAFAYFTFRSASKNGRSGVGWLFANLAAGVGVQFLLPVLIVSGIIVFSGSASVDPAGQLQDPIAVWVSLIWVGCWLFSVAAMYLILDFASRHRKIDEMAAPLPPPPPPPTFDAAE